MPVFVCWIGHGPKLRPQESGCHKQMQISIPGTVFRFHEFLDFLSRVTRGDQELGALVVTQGAGATAWPGPSSWSLRYPWEQPTRAASPQLRGIYRQLFFSETLDVLSKKTHTDYVLASGLLARQGASRSHDLRRSGSPLADFSAAPWGRRDRPELCCASFWHEQTSPSSRTSP